jgi:SAM-dependent methyltransferase
MTRYLFKSSWWKLLWRYWRGNTPWDTQITPPEVMQFIAETPPGRALDLGCGTGTNAITLARSGWQVTGVDYVPQAINMARDKAVKAGVAVEFHLTSVTDLSMLTGTYTYGLDIGCLFSLNADDRLSYAAELARLLATDAAYMLYAWLPSKSRGKTRGIGAEEVDELLGAHFLREKMVVGEEKGSPSAWYWYRRTPH